MRASQICRAGLRLAALGAMAGLLVGCNKMLANFSLNSAKKRLEEAKAHHIEQFDPEGLNQLNDRINGTEQLILSGSFKEARQTGKETATLAKEVLERTKNSRATFLKSEANRWIGFLNLNNGRAENAVLFEQILAENEKGLAAYDKPRWEAAIEAFDKAVRDAEFLLENLRNNANAGLAEVDRLKESLIAEGASENYPEGITEIDQYHARIEDLILNKYDYRTALLTRDQARQAAEASLQKTKEIKSDKLLRQVETLLSRAVLLGAEIYATRTLEDLTREFEDLLKQFYERKFDTVLTSGPGLVPRSEALIVETQRESARAKLGEVERAIAELTEGQARIYLPGRLEQLDQLLDQARGRFGESAFTETEAVCLQALERVRQITDEFDALAQREISDASGLLNIAQSVFTTMETIFAEPAPGPFSTDDQALENMKLGMREELRQVLRNAGLERGTATLLREDKRFDKGIELAKKIAGEAEHVIGQTYHVVAHNTIQHVGNELTRYERDAGREYAPEALSKAQALLEEARRLTREEQYRQSALKAAEAKAQVEILAQELGRVAVEKVTTAEAAVADARRFRAETYQRDLLRQVEALIGQSRARLGQENLKEAIQNAEEVERVAQRIREDSARQWTEDELRRTDIILGRAREAGAEIFAPQALDQAVQLRRSAEDLFSAGNVYEAQKTAAEAALAAEETLYAEVNRAEDEIALAKRYEGWEYESERLSQAIINAKYAREFMDQGDFRRAQDHARNAVAVAVAIQERSRRAGFRDRMTALQKKVDEAATRGPGYYQIGDLSAIVGEMQRLRSEFQPEGYEDAVERIALLEARLAGLLETTPDVLGELVDEMNARLTRLEERGARSETPDWTAEAIQRIKFAQLDFRQGQYRSSFENARDALEVLGRIELRLNERDYDRQVGDLFEETTRVLKDFSPVLNMGTPVLMRMIEGTEGRSQALALVSASKPTVFRQEISDLSARADLMEPPPTRRDVHSALQAMFGELKSSALGFEKLLIMDQYTPRDAQQIVQKAFLEARSARTRQQKIQAQLTSPRAPGEAVGVQRVIQVRP